MRSCPDCCGRGKVTSEPTSDDHDYFRFRHYHRSSPVFEEVCPKCKGRGLLHTGSEQRPQTRAEAEIFRPETDHWTVDDWEWSERFDEFTRRYHHTVEVGDSEAVTTSILGKALALRRMTVANGTTVEEAATALRLLQALMAKYDLTTDSLEECELRRA
jgi:hypothetical protein